jgi:hypothetical protein
MPDVGLTTAAKPLNSKLRVVIKYSIEVEGLPVYNESYDVEKLSAELEKDEDRTLQLWARRLRCAVACRDKAGFSSSLTRCLVDGQCGDFGFESCTPIDQAGRADG